MKKILSIVVLLMLSITMIAQTNFRAITYKQALEAAKTENKLVFMDFYIFVLFLLFTTSSYGGHAGPVRADT